METASDTEFAKPTVAKVLAEFPTLKVRECVSSIWTVHLTEDDLPQQWRLVSVGSGTLITDGSRISTMRQFWKRSRKMPPIESHGTLAREGRPEAGAN